MKIGLCEIFNIDCMEYMAGLPDKAFDLAIVDPPYGIGRAGGETGKDWKWHEPKAWDDAIPKAEYFSELKRVSVHQVIWGANYFTNHIPPSMGWVVWDKGQDLTMSDCELAYTSFGKALRRKVMNRCRIGEHGGVMHPTQKPVALYEWLLTSYAKPGQRILDTHLGSGSSAIACNNMGFEMVGCELDKDYYEAACRRIKESQAQEKLFKPAPVVAQQESLL